MVRSDPGCVVVVREVVERSVRCSSSSNVSAEPSVEETREQCRREQCQQCRLNVVVESTVPCSRGKDRDQWFLRVRRVDIPVEGTRTSADVIRSCEELALASEAEDAVELLCTRHREGSLPDGQLNTAHFLDSH